MKKACFFLFLFSLAICFSANVNAQCAMCTKTAQQLGEKPAQGMNAGILYLMAVPYIMVGAGFYFFYSKIKKKETKEG